jgi:hypothetical protein
MARVPPLVRGIEVTCSVQGTPQSTHLRSSSGTGAGAGGSGGGGADLGMAEPLSCSERWVP